ncbi:MAG: sulfatase-like hydrolase/transferase, partial [Pirellulaceae bacterium]|nr:sulfatase-like hydrolase/transferase [Pirellulaceae bacterium]
MLQVKIRKSCVAVLIMMSAVMLLLGPADSVQAKEKNNLGGTKSSAQRPNILFLFSDDHAIKSISAYGGPLADVAPTPSIDQLARQGAVFLNSFCANSICGPSRATI